MIKNGDGQTTNSITVDIIISPDPPSHPFPEVVPKKRGHKKGMKLMVSQLQEGGSGAGHVKNALLQDKSSFRC